MPHPPIHLGGQYWESYFCTFFLREIDLFSRRLESALPTDAELTATANEAEKEHSERLNRWVNEDSDGADIAERAFEEGADIYGAMAKVRQGIINLFAVGLFHLLEQQMFLFLRRALEWGFVQKAKRPEQRQRPSVDIVKTELKRIGVDMAALASWSDIEVLQLAANCTKHSEGKGTDACAKLREIKPEFFQSKLFGAADGWTHRETLQPLAGDGLFLQQTDILYFVSKAKSFWRELGIAIFSL